MIYKIDLLYSIFTLGIALNFSLHILAYPYLIDHLALFLKVHGSFISRIHLNFLPAFSGLSLPLFY